MADYTYPLSIQTGQLLLLNSYDQDSLVRVQEATALYIIIDAWPGVKFKKANGWPVLSSRLKKQRVRPITGAEWQTSLIDKAYQLLKEYYKLNVSLDDPLAIIELFSFLQKRCLF